MSDVSVDTSEVMKPITEINDDRPSRRKLDPMQIDRLATSMVIEGLRHPVLLLPNGTLLKGRRRLTAAKELGWDTIAARTVSTVEDAVAAIGASVDELSQRRTVEEVVALGANLETLDHSEQGTSYLTLIGETLTRSVAYYKRVRLVVNAAHSQIRPAHVVNVAKQAVADLDAGMATAYGAYRRVRIAAEADVAHVVNEDGLPSTPVPSSAARSRRARAVREEWIRALAARGATSQQIADKLDISLGGIRKITSDMGFTVSADVALAKTQRRPSDPNKIIQVIVDDLDALVWSINAIEVTALDPAKAEEWAAQLGKYARAITRVSRSIKGVQ